MNTSDNKNKGLYYCQQHISVNFVSNGVDLLKTSITFALQFFWSLIWKGVDKNLCQNPKLHPQFCPEHRPTYMFLKDVCAPKHRLGKKPNIYCLFILHACIALVLRLTGELLGHCQDEGCHSG